jgi:hypothetical protein
MIRPLRSRLRAPEALLDAAESAPAAVADEPFEPSVGKPASLLASVPVRIALLRAYLAELRDDADGTAAFAAQALARIGEGEGLLASVTHIHLGIAEWLHRRLAAAERAFASGTAEWQATAQPTITAWRCYELAQVQRCQGRLGRGRPDLPAGPGDHRAAGAAAAAGRWPGVCGPSRGGLPAQRTRHRSSARHQGHRPMPAVRLHAADGRGTADTGVDPAGQR